MSDMQIVNYTEYSARFTGADGNTLAVTVQIPTEEQDLPTHIIIQEPKLIRLTLQEFEQISGLVTEALKTHGWEEAPGDGPT